MKRILVLLCFWAFSINAQIVFCTKGAEWNYNFNQAFSPSIHNVKIYYARDTSIAGQAAKVLIHQWFYKQCNMMPLSRAVCIRQSGDTVFLRGAQTQHTWKVLYNFACIAGQSWTTSVLLNNNTFNTYTVTVNSTTTIVENGFNLKQMRVIYKWVENPYSPNTATTSCSITERFGCSQYMYNYWNGLEATCDAEYFARFLCYRDSTFGLKQFTSYPCNYGAPNNLSNTTLSIKKLNLFPMPASDILVLENEMEGLKPEDITIFNNLGSKVFSSIKESNEKLIINTSELPGGIYFFKIKKLEIEGKFMIIH